ELAERLPARPRLHLPHARRPAAVPDLAMAATVEQHSAALPAAPDFAPAARGSRLDLALRGFCGVYLVVLLVCVVLYKAAFLEMLTIDPYFAVYGIVVALYIVSRFALSVGYRPAPDVGLEPRVAIVMPAFNEEAAIRTS